MASVVRNTGFSGYKGPGSLDAGVISSNPSAANYFSQPTKASQPAAPKPAQAPQPPPPPPPPPPPAPKPAPASTGGAATQGWTPEYARQVQIQMGLRPADSGAPAAPSQPMVSLGAAANSSQMLPSEGWSQQDATSGVGAKLGTRKLPQSMSALQGALLY